MECWLLWQYCVSTMVTGLDQASPFLDRKAFPAEHISSAMKQALQKAKKGSMLSQGSCVNPKGQDLCLAKFLGK